MARTIEEIQAQIINTVTGDATLGPGLTSSSVTAIWRLWTYVVAAAIYTHEVLWDTFRADILTQVAALKPHTLRWYRQKALDYQHGGTLADGQDVYDNTGNTQATIDTQKIVKYAAAIEQAGQVVVKVAKDAGGVITAPSGAELAGIADYFNEVKDAGVSLIVRGVPADHLVLNVDVYYDAGVLDNTGARLDGSSSTPIQDAVKAFLKTMPFDGKFIKAHLTDAMQAVDGVVVPEIRLCQARRDDDPTLSSVDVFYSPYSGFMKIYNDVTDLVLTFIPA